MTGYPYYSPPPPPPPPKCNNSYDTPPPPPPPKCNPCPCVCICQITETPAPSPHYWPPTPPPTPYITPVGPGPQPPPGPSDHTVIIAVFVSLGGAFFLAFLAVGLFCLAKRRKKTIIPPAEAAACVEEHQRIQETITTGPCGEQTVTVTVDDDVQIHEAVAVASHVEPPDYDRVSASHAGGHLKTG